MAAQKIAPFLMFSGQAGEAIAYYTSVFDRSEIIHIQRYGPNEDGPEGTVLHATFTLNGQEFQCIDSYIQHAFTFTPAMSFYVTCDTEEEVDRLFVRLSEGGSVLMPVDAYPFNPKYGWVQDKFGVSWQLGIQNN